jgi:hypothetical protein
MGDETTGEPPMKGDERRWGTTTTATTTTTTTNCYHRGTEAQRGAQRDGGLSADFTDFCRFFAPPTTTMADAGGPHIGTNVHKWACWGSGGVVVGGEWVEVFGAGGMERAAEGLFVRRRR